MHAILKADLARMAIGTLRANPLRSVLTVLGVGVGVMTILAMVSVIQGLTRSFTGMIEALGSNSIFVTKFDPSFTPQRSLEERQRKELTVADAEAIRDEVPTVMAVSPIQEEQLKTVRHLSRQADNCTVIGVTPDYELTGSHFVGYGRFVTAADVRERTHAAVVGPDLVKALFPEGYDPVGSEIRIDGNNFKVVGVMEPLGTFLGQSMDTTVFVPLSTLQSLYPTMRRWSGIGHPESSFTIVIRPAGRDLVPETIESVRDLLRQRRNVPPGEPDNFGISSQDALLDIYNQLTGATYLVLTAISAVSLVIGGIGVMNIMLVSVTERTSEIGLRKSVGATKRSIMLQFLFEAMILTGVGGVVGLAVGEAVSLLINRYSPLPAHVPPWAILLGLTVSAGVGLLFGIYPAWKAANLDPIEALRHE